jgi:preprotein translocase subunit SecE
MALGIYKKGQGYWTRLMSGVALGTLVFMGGMWASDIFRNTRMFGMEPIYTQAFVFTLIVAVFGWIGYYLLCVKHGVVDFMIATEGEMKKVNWSSKREIIGSTQVVLGVTVIIAIFCFCFDLFFQWVFRTAGVLEVID